jgi:hypothetical protein
MFTPEEGFIQVRELQLTLRIWVFREAGGKLDMRSTYESRDIRSYAHKKLGIRTTFGACREYHLTYMGYMGVRTRAKEEI